MTPENVYEVIQELVNFLLRYAVTLAAISALSMALIEAAKAIGSIRSRFHKKSILKWIEESQLSNQGDVYAQLIQLTTGEIVEHNEMNNSIGSLPWNISASNSIFTIELKEMMGQIQSAADVALSYPYKYKEFYHFLAKDVSEDMKEKWTGYSKSPPTSTSVDPNEAKDQADTYTNLHQYIQRRLDAFQLTTSYRWQRLNQFSSWLIGFLLLFGTLLYTAQTNPQYKVFSKVNELNEIRWGLFSIFLFISLIGGIMAPTAKDLVVGLKKIRKDV